MIVFVRKAMRQSFVYDGESPNPRATGLIRTGSLLTRIAEARLLQDQLLVRQSAVQIRTLPS